MGIWHHLQELTASDACETRAQGFVQGMRQQSRASVAILIWGFVTGIALYQYGLSLWQSLAMNGIVYAASAEAGVLPLLPNAAPLLIVMLTGAIVNLRFVIFSIALYPYFRRLSLIKKLFFSWFVGDVVFAWFLSKFSGTTERGTDYQLGYYLGLATWNFVCYQVGGVLGIGLGTIVPRVWQLDFAAILSIIAILVPMCNTLPAIVGSVAAGICCVLFWNLPYNLGLVVGLVAGLAAAMIADEYCERRKRHARD